MKKITKLLGVSVAVCLGSTAIAALAGCGAFATSVTSEEEFMQAIRDENKNISIAADIDMFAREGFFDNNFASYWAKLEDVTIDGNGHTVTIKGDDGVLGSYAKGLFASLTNCTVTDLNIVYNVGLSSSSNSGFGGLSQYVTGSTVSNVNITYKKGFNYKGSEGSAVGGFAAIVNENSTVTNCTVTGDISGSGVNLGGFVGTLHNGSVIKGCSYSGSFSHTINYDTYSDGEYRGCAGGLVGRCYGSISNSYATIDGFDVSFPGSSAWRGQEGDVGLLCGYFSGSLTNCYLDISDEATVAFDRKDSGLWSRTLHGGFICGHATGSAKIKNVYIDATNWENIGDTGVKGNVKGNIGVAKNETTNIENVYFVDKGKHVYNDEITVEYVEIEDETGEFTYYENGDQNKPVTVGGRHRRFKIPCTFLGRDNSIIIDYIFNSSTWEWIYNEATFDVFGDGTYSFTYPVRQVLENSVGKTSRYELMSHDGCSWSFEITLALQDSNTPVGTATVKITKQSDGFNSNQYVTSVLNYSDIEFNSGDNVIGGNAEDYPWTTDSNGKLIFKSAE